MPDFNSNAEVHLTERVQGALHYVDLSTSSECSDDLSLKNIVITLKFIYSRICLL